MNIFILWITDALAMKTDYRPALSSDFFISAFQLYPLAL